MRGARKDADAQDFDGAVKRSRHVTGQLYDRHPPSHRVIRTTSVCVTRRFVIRIENGSTAEFLNLNAHGNLQPM